MGANKQVKYCIVGGGPQGITLAIRLLCSGLVNGVDEIAIVDPGKSPLELLAKRFEDCHTKHLRSGPYDHVDSRNNSLIEFARRLGREDELVTDKKRPTVGLFLDHSRDVFARLSLGESWVSAWATSFSKDGSDVVLQTTAGAIRATHLHLCMGQLAPFYPDWARMLGGHNPRIEHIYDRFYDLCHLPKGDNIAVIGGGITGAQAAVSIANTLQSSRIQFMTRRPINSERGGTNSDYWKDPKRRADLCKTPWQDRWGILRKEGDRGTIPPWETARLEKLSEAGRITYRVCKIALCLPENEHVTIVFEDGSTTIVDTVVLATGLQPTLADWLVQSARKMNLPFDAKDHPILCDDLEWGEASGIKLHGAFAAPVLGPFAGNISGAQLAADLLTQCIVK